MIAMSTRREARTVPEVPEPRFRVRVALIAAVRRGYDGGESSAGNPFERRAARSARFS